MVRLGHGQTLDIVAPRGEQADHAVQHPRLVIDENGVGRLLLLDRGVVEEIGRALGLDLGLCGHGLD